MEINFTHFSTKMAATAPERRLRLLATPKSLPAGFLEDRRSIYWENNISPKDYAKTTTFVLTPRQEELFYSKKIHPEYQGDRPSPIWKVPQAAMLASPTPRLGQLAQPKSLHTNYQQCRQVKTVIPSSALRVRPTQRLVHLSRHKTYPPLPIKENSEWDWGEWATDISQSAKTAQATMRVSSLAEAKRPHNFYKPCRKIQWEVSKAAQSHAATERTQKLAQAKTHNPSLEDYNPQAWSVSRAALVAQASPRMNELATPLPRKVRTKK